MRIPQLVAAVREARQALELARGVIGDDTKELMRLRAQDERLAFFCANCAAIVPVRWADGPSGDIVCQRCSWIIATFHPSTEVQP